MDNSEIYISDLYRIRQAIPDYDKYFSKSFLITGASGLIGSTLVDFFSVINKTEHANIKMILASRNMKHLEQRFGDRLHEDDILAFEYDPMQTLNPPQEPDYIIHTAAPANPKWYSEKPVETLHSIFFGLYHVLEYARKHKTSRTLFVSSSEVYGKKNDSHPYLDNEYGYLDILNARSCYPSAKRLCETMCSAYYQEYQVNTVIVRPGHVYGPSITQNDTRASSDFLRMAARGNDIVMKSPGLQIRSYCYTCDCISAMLVVLLHGKTAEAYNISNPDSICSIREIAESIAECGGVNIRFEVPSDIEKRGYNLMDNSSLDSSKLESLGWKGLFDLQEGVKHSLAILRNES